MLLVAGVLLTLTQVCIVFGAGPVGLLCMAVAKALGARRVIAVDIQQERLDFAKSYAATDIYLPVSYTRFFCTSGGSFQLIRIASQRAG